MKYQRIFTLLIIGVIGVIATHFYVPPIQAAPKAQFSIVYTNDVMGEVEPCG